MSHLIRRARPGEAGLVLSFVRELAEYEKLLVDQEFAEAAHQTARIAYEGALQAAQRQSRYLAAHIAPSAAERSLEPARWWLLAMGAALAIAIWSIGTLVYYSVRDRR